MARERAAGRPPGALSQLPAPRRSGSRRVVGGGGRNGRAALGGERQQVTEIQHSRLLAAAVAALEELGYEGATVAQITRRARVSRRTFYELFASRDDCVVAVLRDCAAVLEQEIRSAVPDGLPWCERMRRGLWATLCFLDAEPTLARVAIVHCARGGGAILAVREALLDSLIAEVDEGRALRTDATAPSALTAHGVLGGALAILRSELARPHPEPLTRLYGELLGLIVMPYVGAAATRREQAKSTPTPSGKPQARAATGAVVWGDPLKGLRMRLTYRTTRVIEGLAGNPGVSNRELGELAGITDQGQVSKLLARLERLGLLVNEGEGHLKGEPNAWALTATGARIAHSIAATQTPARPRSKV